MKLSEEFLGKYKDFPDHMTELSKFVYYRTYSRWLPKENRRETWKETCARAVEYNTSLAATSKEEAEELFDNMYNLKQFISGRSLWIGGSEASKKVPLAGFNCSFVVIDNLVSFDELFYLLMVGTGVGFRILPSDVAKLPTFRQNVELTTTKHKGMPWGDPVTEYIEASKDHAYIIVGDSKEGWKEALATYLRFMTNPKKTQTKLIIDFTKIRPKGTPLMTFGGTASGSESIEDMFNKIHKVITEGEYSSKPVDGKLRPIHCLDICNLIGQNVVVGGVRRTAEIALIDPKDTECTEAKSNLTPEKYHRFMSNNSLYIEETPTKEYLQKIFDSIRATGEPGFVNVAESKRRRGDYAGTNPCVTGDTEILTGEHGYVQIKDVVDTDVTIWNGYEWSQVRPRVTGYNQPILEVKFSNGTSLKCTDYHKFVLVGGERVMATELSIGDKLEKWTLPDGKASELVYVTEIVRRDNEPTVYCFTEPKNHTGIFNGVMTAQCGEILLPANAVCNLTTINLTQFVVRGKYKEQVAVDWTGLKKAIRLSARAGYRMTCVDLELPGWNEIHHRDRLLGCSITGYQDLIGMLPEGFNEELFLEEMKKWTRFYADEYAEELGTPKPKLVTSIKPEGCTTSDMMRTLDDGVLFLEEIYKGITNENTAYGFHEIKEPYSVAGNIVRKIYKNDLKNVKRITLKNGRILRITDEHPMAVNGEWVSGSDLKEGMVIDHYIGTYRTEENQKLKEIDYTIYRSDARLEKYPTEMNEDLAWLIGAYFANGSFTSNHRIKFHCQYKEVHDKVQRIWKEQFGIDTHIVKLTDRDSFVQDFRRVAVRQWLDSNGIRKYDDEGEMYVPEVIRRSSWKCILSFIVGYADNDGCFSNKSFCIDSSKETFVRHMQQVAEAVGISFGVSCNTSRENSFSKAPMWKLHLSRAFSSEAAINYINQNSVKAKLKGFVEKGIVKTKDPYTIVKIEDEGNVPTYDIEVENIHCYYQGGLLSHNTLSLIAGGVSPGVHYQHSPYFIRRIRVNASDPLAKTALELGWQIHPEVGQTMENATTLVIDFPCKTEARKTKNDVSAIEQLKTYLMFQKNYTEHNASNTISVKPNEWEEVVDFVHTNWNDVLGVTFLESNSTYYPLMPYEECTKEVYDDLVKKTKQFDPEILNNMEITTRNMGKEYEILDDKEGCENGVCPIR